MAPALKKQQQQLIAKEGKVTSLTALDLVAFIVWQRRKPDHFFELLLLLQGLF